ncbi:double zinc ribbon domain-containing protein [Paenibacillus sp. FA6]|uniref:double zinc ribbon domain-containing protein n=1 Tax=Paenibacillus sp. FA6 TaxID=3413029 RepID=UPI003F65F39C
MSFFNKLKEGATKAADKAKDSVDVVRINAQISAKQKEIDKSYLMIGESVFNAYAVNDLTIAEQIIKVESDKIIILQQENHLLTQRIKQIKDEKTCSCGKAVPMNTKFCASCGNKFDVIDSEEAVVIVETIPNVIVCSDCGSTVAASNEYCENCGQKV